MGEHRVKSSTANMPNSKTEMHRASI